MNGDLVKQLDIFSSETLRQFQQARALRLIFCNGLRYGLRQRNAVQQRCQILQGRVKRQAAQCHVIGNAQQPRAIARQQHLQQVI